MCRYPNTKLWITEFAYNDVTLAKSQAFFNYTMKLLDVLDYVERYSYFGAFRSTKSNVGPNATFLDAKGRLTDIGSRYLGGAATENIPSTSKVSHHHRSAADIAVRSMVSTVVGWVATTGWVF